MPRDTDRSRNLAYQLCRRMRWWGWEFMNRGLEADSSSYDLAIGKGLHRGMELMLKCAELDPLEQAIAEYRESVEEPSKGHEALIKALLLAYQETQLPSLLETYEILEVEKEMAQMLSPAIRMLGRADARFRHKQSGFISLYSIKSTQEFQQSNLDDAQVDMQGLSESWLSEQETGELVDSVQMHYFIKGKRQKADELQPGDIPQYKSPLIYGYKRLVGTAYEYAHSYNYTCRQPHKKFSGKGKYVGECPGGANHRLTDDWQSFEVWNEMGIEEWFRMIRDGEVQPDLCSYWDLLDKQFAWAPPINRSQEDITRWHRSMIALESEVEVGSRVCNQVLVENPSQLEQMLDLFFTRSYREENCNRQYGRKCKFFNLCHRGGAEDPFSSGFRWRTPNHPLEKTNQTIEEEVEDEE